MTNILMTDGLTIEWDEDAIPKCSVCDDDIDPPARAQIYTTCKACGEKDATAARRSWCVLTLHKQGPMLFTPEFAREAAIGANNKGGIVK